MPKTRENWFGHINSCIYDACQTCEIYKLTETFEIHRFKQYFTNIVLFGIKEL